MYGVSASDPVTYVTVAAAFVGVAMLASYSPALRATKIDSIEALRAD